MQLVRLLGRRGFYDFIFEARKHTERKPLLGLFVHPLNRRAKGVYEKAGFTMFQKSYLDARTGTVYEGMLLEL